MLRIGQRRLVSACLYGRVLCCRCLRKRVLSLRTDWPRQRAALPIPKLRAMLDSDKPLRFKPLPYVRIERRARHEELLQRNLLVLRRHDLTVLKRAMNPKE